MDDIIDINPTYLDKITSKIGTPKYHIGQTVKTNPVGKLDTIQRIYLLTNHSYKKETDPEKLTFGYCFLKDNWYEEKLLDFYQQKT